MIKHVVMWKFKEDAEGNGKSENINLAKTSLKNLFPLINEISSLEVGENFNSTDAAFDLVLITEHEDKSALSHYVLHPAHQQVASFIGKVVADRKVVDYEF